VACDPDIADGLIRVGLGMSAPHGPYQNRRE
jgi:hypothetical protein